MGRPCRCCGSNKKIAYLGGALNIFKYAISSEYSDIAVFADGSNFTDNFGDFVSLGSLKYKYVKFDPAQYDTYDGITIGTSACGYYVGTNSEWAAVKKFIEEKGNDNFIFWHNEWSNWVDFPSLTSCFDGQAAKYYSDKAAYLGLNVVFDSDTNSPTKTDTQANFGTFINHSTSIPFLSGFSKQRIFQINAAGKCSNVQAIAYSDSAYKNGGECIYYEVASSGVKMVYAADSNFCDFTYLNRYNDVFDLSKLAISGSPVDNHLNPLFARALIQRAGY